MNNHDDYLPTKELEERFMYRAETYHHRKHRAEKSASKSKSSSSNNQQYYSFDVNVTQPLQNLDQVLDEIPVIIGTNLHEGEMFVHGAFPIPMSKAVYWMFVGALFKDSATKVLKHYRPYVAQVEKDANDLATKQIEEEENKQYYMENRFQLDEEYKLLLALNNSNDNGHHHLPASASKYIQDLINSNSEGGSDEDDDSDDNDPQLVPPEVVEQLIRTFSAGGGGEKVVESVGNSTAGASSGKKSWLLWPFNRLAESTGKADEEARQRLEAKRRVREERRKERMRAKALKEAAKVVVDYRPVMSRIITDYLFRCPSWHYAHSLSENRVKKGKKNNVYVYRFSQPTHIPGFEECWGKVCPSGIH